jgi:hypothetical protein
LLRIADARGSRTLPLASGNVRVRVADGYRLIYAIAGGVPLVNLKIERSDASSFANDATALDKALAEMRTPDHELRTLSHLGRSYTLLIDADYSCTCGTLGAALVFFPEDNLSVTAYFLNGTLEELGTASALDLRTTIDRFMPSYIEAVASSTREAARDGESNT